MAMASKRKRVSEVYQFFKQREGYFICEIENDSGSSCGLDKWCNKKKHVGIEGWSESEASSDG